jgi:hypothetical protein
MSGGSTQIGVEGHGLANGLHHRIADIVPLGRQQTDHHATKQTFMATGIAGGLWRYIA